MKFHKKSDLVTGSSFERLRYQLSLVYQKGVRLRNWAYKRKMLVQQRLPNFVVSIGNIVAGGTGKTAFVEKLAFDLHQNVTILTRGYKSRVEKSGLSVDITKTQSHYRICGDEPYMLKQNLPKAQIIVGKDRILSASLTKHKLIILDDGMQYRKIARDCEVVMLHADDLFGGYHFLPRGFLREDPLELRHADYIVVNHILDEEHVQRLLPKIRFYSEAPVIGVRYSLKDAQVFQEKKLAVFCGLGHPESFLKSLEAHGIHPLAQYFTEDHEIPSLKKLEKFSLEAKEKGAELILCTQKDFVKLPESLKCALPIEWIKGELTIISGKQDYQYLIKTLSSL